MSTIIRFPVKAKLGEPIAEAPPMAERLSLRARLKQWLIGPPKKKVTRNSVKFDYVRRTARRT